MYFFEINSQRHLSITDGRTYRISESSHGNMSTHKKFNVKGQNLELAVGSLYTSPDDGISDVIRKKHLCVFQKKTRFFFAKKSWPQKKKHSKTVFFFFFLHH